MSGALALVVMGVAGLAQSAPSLNLSPDQQDRPRGTPDAAAIKLIPENFRFVEKGVLTVGISVSVPPISVYATDAKTIVGADPDLAQLVADELGLKLKLVPLAWADWPLAVASGKVDAVLSNVTVTEERKEKFDFSTYRNDQLGIYVKSDSKLGAIKEPKDIAGLKVIVSASTNQEQILLRWNKQNVAAGLKPVEIQYYDDDVVQRLALQSGRADAYLGPNAIAAYEARDGKTRLAGLFSGGWPLNAEIAVTSRKGSGIAEAVTLALNTQIKNGNYAKALSRWNLDSEAIAVSRTNPPGLPKN